MAALVFGPHLRQHVGPVPNSVPGSTLGEVLAAAFAAAPTARGYVLDNQGAVRKHVALFIDGNLVLDRQQLSDPVAANAQVLVMQALSGG